MSPGPFEKLLEPAAIESALATNADGGELMLREVATLSLAISAKRQADLLNSLVDSLDRIAQGIDPNSEFSIQGAIHGAARHVGRR